MRSMAYQEDKRPRLIVTGLRFAAFVYVEEVGHRDDVGAALVGLTGFTVFLSYVNFDKWMPGRNMNMIIGMIVAAFKVSLVGAIFMHLKGEKWTIWKFLLFTAFFVTGLFMLTLLHYADPIFGTTHSTH